MNTIRLLWRKGGPVKTGPTGPVATALVHVHLGSVGNEK